MNNTHLSAIRERLTAVQVTTPERKTLVPLLLQLPYSRAFRSFKFLLFFLLRRESSLTGLSKSSGGFGLLLRIFCIRTANFATGDARHFGRI